MLRSLCCVLLLFVIPALEAEEGDRIEVLTRRLLSVAESEDHAEYVKVRSEALVLDEADHAALLRHLETESGWRAMAIRDALVIHRSKPELVADFEGRLAEVIEKGGYRRRADEWIYYTRPVSTGSTFAGLRDEPDENALRFEVLLTRRPLPTWRPPRAEETQLRGDHDALGRAVLPIGEPWEKVIERHIALLQDAAFVDRLRIRWTLWRQLQQITYQIHPGIIKPHVPWLIDEYRSRRPIESPSPGFNLFRIVIDTIATIDAPAALAALAEIQAIEDETARRMGVDVRSLDRLPDGSLRHQDDYSNEVKGIELWRLDRLLAEHTEELQIMANAQQAVEEAVAVLESATEITPTTSRLWQRLRRMAYHNPEVIAPYLPWFVKQYRLSQEQGRSSGFLVWVIEIIRVAGKPPQAIPALSEIQAIKEEAAKRKGMDLREFDAMAKESPARLRMLFDGNYEASQWWSGWKSINEALDQLRSEIRNP